MRKILITLVLLASFTTAGYSQINRSATTTYAGIGYSLVFFTNGEVSDNYPLFNLSKGEFLTEINPFFGIRPARSIAVEISPSFLFTTTEGNDGFYFDDETGRRFYKSRESSIFAIPINLNFKVYPFQQDLLSMASNIYAGIGGGIMFISEEFVNDIFVDSNQVGYLGTRAAKDDFWNENLQVMVGYGSTSQFGYDFMLSYRFVPLDQKRLVPVTSNIASNYNSVNLSIRLNFNF